MALNELFKKQGDWLFQRRSYLPLLLLPLLLLALPDTESIIRARGETAMALFRAFCFIVSVVGLGVRVVVAAFVPRGTSGRNRGGQKAESLNTTGIYSVVRHPLYLGNFLIFMGIIAYTLSWWLILMSAILFTIYYERIMYTEETFLREKFGENFTSWASRTPAFLPKLSLWIPSGLTFSFRNILKREYNTFLTTITGFTVIHYASDFFGNYRFDSGLTWLFAFLISLVIYLTIRTLKKKTRTLNVEGR